MTTGELTLYPNMPPHFEGVAAEVVPAFLEFFDVEDRNNIEAITDYLEGLRSGIRACCYDLDDALTRQGVNGWRAMSVVLPLALQLESKGDRGTCLVQERAGLMTAEDYKDWTRREGRRHVWLGHLAIFDESVPSLDGLYGTAVETIKTVAAEMALREGARELFEVGADADVPSHIFSGSPDILIKSLGLRNAEVHATVLEVQNGHVSGVDEEHIVHPGNKHEFSKKALAGLGVSGVVLVLGSHRPDADMVLGRSVFCVRVAEGEEGNTLAYLEESFSSTPLNSKGYHAVLRTPSLLPLVALFQWALESGAQSTETLPAA